MILENGSECEPMSKAEAKASVKEMEKMMEFFDGVCDVCGKLRKNCSNECIENKIEHGKT